MIDERYKDLKIFMNVGFSRVKELLKEEKDTFDEEVKKLKEKYGGD